MRIKGKSWLLLGLGLVFLFQAGGICWSQSTERVSVDTNGDDADSASSNPSISSIGRYVAFQSDATDLVTGGSNGLMQIFVRDRQTGTTSQVSVNSGGNEGDFPSSASSISGDGWHVAFESWATNLEGIGDGLFPDIFVHNRQTGDTTRVSVDSAGLEGAGPSFRPSISADGRYVAFDSEADLVAADSGNYYDIFVHDRDADENGTYDEPAPLGISTIRVSVDAGGDEADDHSYSPSISPNGRYVAFESIATNLVTGGSNGFIHIFVHDRDADGDGIYDEAGAISTVQVSVDSAGTEGNADSGAPSISADGRYASFESDAINLLGAGNDTNGSADVFVHDLQTGTTTRVSVDSNGIQGNGDSSAPSISSDGKFVAFESGANNLVGAGNDNNGVFDIFLHERESLPPNVDSTSPANNANGVAVGASITATFSEAMQASTINATTFTLDNGVTGTVSYDGGSATATFTPTSNLDYDTTYTATITTGAEDLAGNGLLAPYLWTFTTQSEGNSNGVCFIATAAHGTSMRGQVRVVRGVLLLILLITWEDMKVFFAEIFGRKG